MTAAVIDSDAGVAADLLPSPRMSKFVIAMIIVAAILAAGLMSLLRNWRQPMGTPETLERAKRRNEEIEARERRDDER